MFKRSVFILTVVSAIGTASLEAGERWTDERDAQFGFAIPFPSHCLVRLRATASLASIILLPTPSTPSFSSAPGTIGMMQLQNISSVG